MSSFVTKIVTAIAFVVVAGGLGAIAIPTASQSDPSDLIARGRAVFEKTAGGIGCAACHGHFAMGDLGSAPNIRSADETRVKNALRGVGAMRFFTLTDEEVSAVQAFLRSLATLVPLKVEINDARFEPDRIAVPVNRPIQFIFDNKGEQACNFVSQDAGITAKELEPGAVNDVVWTSPRKGTFTAHCAQRPDIALTIVVDDAKTAGVTN